MTLFKQIISDETKGLLETRDLLERTCCIPYTTLQDRMIVKNLAESIGTRSARLAAAGIVAILLKVTGLIDSFL